MFINQQSLAHKTQVLTIPNPTSQGLIRVLSSFEPGPPGLGIGKILRMNKIREIQESTSILAHASQRPISVDGR